MDYETFLLRLAQAETKLLQLGILEEPISFNDPVAQQTQPVDNKKGAMEMYQEYLNQ